MRYERLEKVAKNDHVKHNNRKVTNIPLLRHYKLYKNEEDNKQYSFSYKNIGFQSYQKIEFGFTSDDYSIKLFPEPYNPN